MYGLPTTITVKDNTYTIRNAGDYRMVLDCFEALNDTELDKSERLLACIAIFLEDITDVSQVGNLPDIQELCTEIMRFFNCGQLEETAKPLPYKLIDWQRDETLICSAINKVAGKEVRAEKYIHWWTFMGYYVAVGESALSTVVGIRMKQSKNKKLEKHERQFITDNPQYFNWDRRTAAQIEEDEFIRSIWNADKKDK